MGHTPGPIVRLGRVEHCEIGNFHAIGQERREPTAYAATEQDADLYAAAPELLQALTRWAMAMWQAGISPVENSYDPLEAILFDTHAALQKATGTDVVAETLERMCAANRAALAKAEG